MLPKRKLIKKRHRRPEEPEQNVNMETASIVEILHSGDPNATEEALVYISSMCSVKDMAEMLPLLAEMVAILIRGPTSSIYQCLYALSNLIDLQPSMVPQLFQFGLSKALTQLNSSDMQLLKPILSLMSSLHNLFPSEQRYLQSAVEQSLNTGHLQSHSKEQVLRYLNQIESASLKEEIYEKIYYLLKNQQKLSIRALCVCILLKNKIIRQKISKDILQFCEEVLCDIDLEKQHQNNVINARPAEKAKDVQTDMIEQEEEIVVSEHPNLEVFNDAVEAVQTLMEGLLLVLEEGETNQGEGIEEEEECENEEWNNDIEAEKIEESSTKVFDALINDKFITIAKNTLLSFPEGQNIVCLTLRLLAYSSNVDKETLVLVIMKCFENMSAVQPDIEIQQEVLMVGLHLLLKCPLAQHHKQVLLFLGENVLKVSHNYKDSWLQLLQLYSSHFNPEKCPVSAEQNKRAGAILMNLIVNIPELKLQEWRGQAIDTMFDVFSNEQFDGYLVQLGLLGVLEKVIAHVGPGKKKKFVKDVITDIQRFLQYKKKMIKF